MTLVRNARLLLLSLRQDAGWALQHVVVRRVLGSWLVPRALRLLGLRLLGVQVGYAQVLPGVHLATNRLTLGHDAYVNVGCFFDNAERVTLGDGVRVGQEVMFCTTSHELGGPDQRGGASTSAPIAVGDGVWIGARSVLLPGVVVGAGCVIAAGAVVTRDCEPDGLYAGVPAVRVRELG